MITCHPAEGFCDVTRFFIHFVTSMNFYLKIYVFFRFDGFAIYKKVFFGMRTILAKL